MRSLFSHKSLSKSLTLEKSLSPLVKPVGVCAVVLARSLLLSNLSPAFGSELSSGLTVT